MTIQAATLVTASGKRKTEITIREDGVVTKQYRRRRLWPIGHLRIFTNGRVEFALGRFTNSRAITLREARS